MEELAPWKPGRGCSERSLSLPTASFHLPTSQCSHQTEGWHSDVGLPPGHASNARFLSCGASGHLRGCTAARCSADLYLQASWAQVTGVAAAWSQAVPKEPGASHQPHQLPWWGAPAESPEGTMQTPEPSALASGGRRGFAEGHRESLEKAMAPHSRTLAWKIPWTEEPGGLQSMGSLGVRHY